MNYLSKGEFYGQTNERQHMDGITLTDTEYTHDKVDWHYHEHPYFTFILQGRLLEGNKKETYHCSPGTLLFHNWQEPHYNIKPKGFARGFHIELGQKWLADTDFDLAGLQGNIPVSNPDHKLLLYKIFRETKINDQTSSLSIQALLLQALTGMHQGQDDALKTKPAWVKRLIEILHERRAEKLSLTELAQLLDIHPVHLSRDFSKHFRCGLGDYIRKLKIERSLSLLPDKKQSLAAIAFECGFSDQSHFIRCFKNMVGASPLAYRKILLR